MKYSHHPDPAIGFCIEVDVIEGLVHNVGVGLANREEVNTRIARAMQFRIGGDTGAVAAKNRLRELETSMCEHCQGEAG